MRISDWSSDLCSSDLARNILSASDRDETAIIYSRLKPIYDRVIYDPVDLPQPQNSVPSIDTNGSAFKAIALSEHMTSVVEPPRRPSPFKDLWRHDHATKSRLLITVTIRSEEHTSELQSLMRISYAF